MNRKPSAISLSLVGADGCGYYYEVIATYPDGNQLKRVTSRTPWKREAWVEADSIRRELASMTLSEALHLSL